MGSFISEFLVVFKISTVKKTLYRTQYPSHPKGVMGNDGHVKRHFASCGLTLTHDDISILSSSVKSEKKHLETLEALFIKEHSPVLNTQETYKSKTLKIKF